MSNLIVNPEHPRVAVLNEFEQLVRCTIFAGLRIQCFCYWLADRRKMNPPRSTQYDASARVAVRARRAASSLPCRQ